MAKIKVTQKNKAVLAIISLLILFSVLGVWIFMQFKMTDQDDQSAAVIPVEQVHLMAVDYMNSGDIDEGLQLYDRQIKAQKNDNEKRELLLDKSGLATSAGRYKDAIAAAKQAESISKSDDIEVLRVLADAYAASGDKKQALNTYKQILKLSPKGEAQEANSLERRLSVEEIVKELEQ